MTSAVVAPAFQQQSTPAPSAPGKTSTHTPGSFITVKRTGMDVSAGTKLLTEAINAKEAGSRASAADDYAKLAMKTGVLALTLETNFADTIIKGLNAPGKKDVNLKAGAAGVVQAVLDTCGKDGELAVWPVFQTLLDATGDKSKNVREAAHAACKIFIASCDKNLTVSMTKILYTQSTHAAGANLARLQFLSSWIQNRASKPSQYVLTEALAQVIKDIHDISKDVAAAAQEALKWLLASCTNVDIVPLAGVMSKGLMNLGQISDTVDALAGTIFIQTVDTPSLAVMSPILINGLAQRTSNPCKRACARIIENMAKLVEEPRDLANFVDLFLPLLENARDNVADPEVRTVCGKAVEIFIKKADVSLSKLNLIDRTVTLNLLTEATKAYTKEISAKDQPLVDFVFQKVAEILVMLNNTVNYDHTEWHLSVTPYLAVLLAKADAEALTDALFETASSFRVKKEEKEESFDAEELCNLEFSLAFGNKVLLKKTKLRLHRGFKYGLMGGNDCGKTSLMRAIASNSIDGFPTGDQLRTVFVETDVQGELSDLTTLDYMFADPILRDCGATKETMAKTLQSVGFRDGSPANITTCVGELSGGWRMKLALARAMLLNADVLMLDEPTNHLDTYNVKWLQDYLLSLKDVTVVMVSHDVKVLDAVCTNIIHIKDLKIESFKGNLSAFVQVYPAAKCYFELIAEKFSFKFPLPGKIPGINSKGKAIMKMQNISFTYPTATKAQLTNVSVQVCLASRTGIVGVNGAGKSTMIRLLMGELEPDEGSGEVWKHPNARVGYIAQHAFHHIEEHLEQTCNEYIRWRYQTGDDREALVKVTAILTEEEMAKQQATIEIPIYDAEGKESKIKAIIMIIHQTRQTNRKKGYNEYECTLEGKQGTKTWVPVKILEENGWAKVVKQIDERIALRETQFARPLTVKNVVEHMQNIGLEEEFSTHIKIGALSTGQKVKVVLGAALWNQPHILILDEPTNYLDRESLGALAGAIREFEGGVIMISHNSQFVDTLCPQIWHLENNTLNIKGDADWMREANKDKISDKEEIPTGGLEMVDKFGNTVVLKKAKQELSNKEKRAKDRAKKNNKKNGIAGEDEEDEEEW